ncbi:MYCBP-associated protein isoform X2 [Mixophyes fleayi]|uniref:MYCBP-associated protein isoform X2 n=1 Tax=Mixophyes fleayi TaxID=3061075 RepID=UPI003F4DF335
MANKPGKRETRARTPPEKKKLKGLEPSSTPVQEQTELATSSVLQGDEIQALAIKLGDLEKLHPPRCPKEEQKASVTSRILIRKHHDQEFSKKRRLLVARPVPPESATKGQDPTDPVLGAEVLLCDAHSPLQLHNILGSLQDLNREATARGNLQVAQLIPQPPHYDVLGTHVRTGRLEQKETYRHSQKQDHALSNWHYHMNLRKRQLNALSRQLCKPSGQLVMSVCGDFRRVQEERDQIDHCIPVVEDGKGYRVGSEFWNVSEHIGDELSGLTLTLTQSQRGYPLPVTHVGQPQSIKEETGTIERPPFHHTWDKSLYLQHRRHKLKAVMEELNFTKPDIDGLEVIGRGQPFTSVFAEKLPLSEKLQETPPEEKENQDPLGDFPDVVSDVFLGPSLLFCGQQANWVESLGSHRDKVGISTRITFEALAGETASSDLEILNNGTAALWYEWRRLPHDASLGDLHKEPHVQRFYFNTSAGVILPGESQIFSFHFKSPTAGIFGESWEFCTHPVLLAGALIQVSLWGISLYEDKTAPLREALQRELESREAMFIVQKMVQEILDEVRSPERPPSPVIHVSEEELFHLDNPKLHYKHQTVQDLHQLWKEYICTDIQDSVPISEEAKDHLTEATSLLDGPGAEEKTKSEWNLSVVDLKRAANSIHDDEMRETFLHHLNRKITELCEPTPETSLDLLRQACLQLWREAIDELVERSTELRSVLEMPDKDVTAEFVIEELVVDQKRVKGGKEDKRGGGGGLKEGKKSPGGKEKDEKKGGRLGAREKEERPSSRKGKGKEDKKAVKSVAISQENKELVSSGESFDVTPPESRVFQVDPVIQEKYQKHLYIEVYGILASLAENLVLIAEDLNLCTSVAEDESQDGSECV